MNKVKAYLKMGKELDFDKLKGGQNYHTWQFAMRNFLKLKGLGDCIIHRPNSPAVAASSGVTARPEVVYADHIAIETDNTKVEQAQAYSKM